MPLRGLTLVCVVCLEQISESLLNPHKALSGDSQVDSKMNFVCSQQSSERSGKKRKVSEPVKVFIPDRK